MKGCLMNAIEVKNVSMKFNLYREKVDNIKELMIKKLKRNIHYDEFYALKDISFNVRKGDAFAIIGANGSGKSTLLKIISGIFRPTNGSVITYGEIAPLIELGSGFDYELTARENIFLNGAVLGYNRKFMECRFEEIMDFSEMWDFVDVPIKNFSSGMTARLGFSIATIVKPDILIVDEILSVGDMAFQKKCEKKMNDLMSGGTTMLLVSHSEEQVRKMCHQAIWLDKGIIRQAGGVNEVCDAYENRE